MSDLTDIAAHTERKLQRMAEALQAIQQLSRFHYTPSPGIPNRDPRRDLAGQIYVLACKGLSDEDTTT